MQFYEYTAIPAPARGEKIRAARTPADRYAHALTNALNGMAEQGWEYVRAETLPSEERSGLTGRTTVWMNVLVFRRALPRPLAEDSAAETLPVPAPAATGSVANREAEPGRDPAADDAAAPATPQGDAAPAAASARP